MARRSTPALVAVVTQPRDWRCLETEHWYRIPLRAAPENLERYRWLAFYQTAAFGAEKWSVNCYAKITGITTIERIRLLPDEPDHPRSHDHYYRLAIDRLRRLKRPIPSRRLRRIVFIPTTLERLFRAAEINDLFHTSPIEDRLYNRPRREGIPAERQFSVREKRHSYLLDLALFCRDGNIDIECDGERWHTGPDKAETDRDRDNTLTAAGWRILRFSGREIIRKPQECLQTIRRTARRLGGPAD